MILDGKNTGDDVQQIQSCDTSPTLCGLQQKIVKKILDIHHISYIGGEIEKDAYIENNISEIRENMSHISEIFYHSLGLTAINGVSLFESPGVITKVSNEFKTTSYQDFNNSFIGQSELSAVAQSYEPALMTQVCIKKAMMHALIHMIPQGTPLHTSMVQQYLQEFTKTPQYRGGYQHPDTTETFGVSGTSMNEQVVEKILIQAGHIGNLEEIAERFRCGKVDLLAGIGDELMSRLIAHNEVDWEEQIQIVANDIKQHMNNNTLGLLC